MEGLPKPPQGGENFRLHRDLDARITSLLSKVKERAIILEDKRKEIGESEEGSRALTSVLELLETESERLVEARIECKKLLETNSDQGAIVQSVQTTLKATSDALHIEHEDLAFPSTEKVIHTPYSSNMKPSNDNELDSPSSVS